MKRTRFLPVVFSFTTLLLLQGCLFFASVDDVNPPSDGGPRGTGGSGGSGVEDGGDSSAGSDGNVGGGDASVDAPAADTFDEVPTDASLEAEAGSPDVSVGDANDAEASPDANVVDVELDGPFLPVEPLFSFKWNNPTGWTGSDGQPVKMMFSTAGLPRGTRFECRTGKRATFADIGWSACDGGSGMLPEHQLLPPSTVPVDQQGGTYRTEYRYWVAAYVSPVIGYDYYVHHALDGAQTCKPTFTDDQYFEAAKAYAAAHPNPSDVDKFPILPWDDGIPSGDAGTEAGAGDASTNAGPRDGGSGADGGYHALINLENPFIQITFVDLSLNRAAINFWQPRLKNPMTVSDVFSLHHRFTMNPERTMILRKRVYSGGHGCVDTPRFGSYRSGYSYPNCEALVLNRSGQGLCFGATSDASTVPLLQAFTLAGWQKIRNKERCTGDPQCNHVDPKRRYLPQ